MCTAYAARANVTTKLLSVREIRPYAINAYITRYTLFPFTQNEEINSSTYYIHSNQMLFQAHCSEAKMLQLYVCCVEKHMRKQQHTKKQPPICSHFVLLLIFFTPEQFNSKAIYTLPSLPLSLPPLLLQLYQLYCDAYFISFDQILFYPCHVFVYLYGVCIYCIYTLCINTQRLKATWKTFITFAFCLTYCQYF